MVLDDEVAHVGQVDVALAFGAETASWREAHRQLLRIAKRRGALDADEATWLLRAKQSGAHRELGFGSFSEYVERTLGCSPRTARERIRVAERLAELPEIRASLARGETSYSAVRELTRVATPETEEDLIEDVRGKTVREVEDLVLGDAPRNHKLTLDLTPAAYVQYQAAKRMLQDQAGEALDDTAVIAAMSQTTLDGGATQTRTRHQLAVTVCPTCEAATIDAPGEIIAITPDELAQAQCDAAHVSHAGAVTVDVPTKVRRAVERRDHHRCRVPGCRASLGLHLHHLQERAQHGTHTEDNLILLCSAHHAAHHAGRLRVVGATAAAVTFEHGDRRAYGEDDPRAVAVATLRQLGYAPAQAKHAVEAARATLTQHQQLDLETLLRAALRASGRSAGGPIVARIHHFEEHR